MDDLISRQAAIDALGERPMVWVGSDYELGARNQYDADVLALETVPSAQPQSCKDAVSKADVLETYSELYDVFDDNKEIKNELHKIYDKINALQAAQPEIIRCRDCKHYYYADNRIPQERMCVCDLDGERWSPDSYCSFAERREDGQ